jgi:hypothetical protein
MLTASILATGQGEREGGCGLTRTCLARVVVFAAVVLSAPVAVANPPAGGSFTLVQNATLVHPGYKSKTAAEVATTGNPFTWGAVQFAIPSNLTLGRLNTLSTDYEFVTGSCWGGSPRFEVWVTNGTGTHKIFFYVGPAPSYTGCTAGTYLKTGNLSSPTSFVDDSQLPGGSFYDTYSNAEANYGNYAVTAVYLDADGGWNGEQVIDFDNTQVNGTVYTYEG